MQSIRSQTCQTFMALIRKLLKHLPSFNSAIPVSHIGKESAQPNRDEQERLLYALVVQAVCKYVYVYVHDLYITVLIWCNSMCIVNVKLPPGTESVTRDESAVEALGSASKHVVLLWMHSCRRCTEHFWTLDMDQTVEMCNQKMKYQNPDSRLQISPRALDSNRYYPWNVH